VKLNNIEYAMQSLDKIEQEIQVDKMAEIVQKHDEQSKRAGNAPKKPRTENFVFTVKIIEAEDLMACDINGFSDPYVVLGDVQRRLHKTRIIYRNLNPRWDETVDIVTQGPLNITATVWDWDALGEHDCVGRTSLKLDPSHFRDYMPREYWLDLDTQGRLLLRVSMEGERDDIQFHFGKAFRTLKRTERDMTRNITDKVGILTFMKRTNRLALGVHSIHTFPRASQGIIIERHFRVCIISAQLLQPQSISDAGDRAYHRGGHCECDNTAL
jgi:hypothetical protein